MRNCHDDPVSTVKTAEPSWPRNRSELAIGDVRQASEKGWGAAALMLKAVAEQRGWEHGKHRHLSRVASRLRAETGDRDIYRWFQVADALHGNFYEDETEPEDIDDSLNDVELPPGQAGAGAGVVRHPAPALASSPARRVPTLPTTEGSRPSYSYG